MTVVRVKVEERAVGDRDDASRTVDGESATGAVVEGVGDSVVGRVGIAGRSSQANGCSIGRVFSHRIGCRIAVADGSDIELVDIGQVDDKVLGRETAVIRGGPNRDRMTCRDFVIEQRGVGDGDRTGRGIDCKPPASIVIQRVGDGVSGCIGIGSGSSNVYCGAVRRVFGDGIGGGVGVGNRSDVELIDVVEVDGKDVGGEAAVAGGRSDGDVVAGCRLAVEQRAVGYRHHTS